jgi:hypothetical protein
MRKHKPRILRESTREPAFSPASLPLNPREPAANLRIPTVSAADTRRTLITDRGSDSMAVAVVGWAEQYKQKTKRQG